MDTVRQFVKNPLVTGIAGLVIGAIFGLVVLGWWIWPVQWVNATPEHLSYEWKTEFLRMSIGSFGLTGGVASAQEQYSAVGEDAEQILSDISMDPQGLSDVLIGEYMSVVGSGAPAPLPPAEGTVEAPIAATEPVMEGVSEEPDEDSGSSFPILLAALCVLLLAIAGFLGYMFFFRKKSFLSGQPTPATQAAEARKEVGYTDYATAGSDTPIAQFMASYKLGDDLFDDSFSIDSPSGEFLGECGVGISETIGVGDHKKVTAFEVWLFDKNDIQTITKVLMSTHAFNDPTIRQRLEAKGEPVLLEPGIETVLETQTLQLSARVVDTSYGDGSMPEESFFDHMLVELAVWSKA